MQKYAPPQVFDLSVTSAGDAIDACEQKYAPPQVFDLSASVICFRQYGSGPDVQLKSLDGLWSVHFDDYARAWVARCHVTKKNEEVYRDTKLEHVLDSIRLVSLAERYLIKPGSETVN